MVVSRGGDALPIVSSILWASLASLITRSLREDNLSWFYQSLFTSILLSSSLSSNFQLAIYDSSYAEIISHLAIILCFIISHFQSCKVHFQVGEHFMGHTPSLVVLYIHLSLKVHVLVPSLLWKNPPTLAFTNTGNEPTQSIFCLINYVLTCCYFY